MNESKSGQICRRDFVKTAMIGAAAVTASASGLLALTPNASAAGPSVRTHKSDFSVITIGTGNPIPDKNRAGSCTMIQYQGKYHLLDTGNGTNDVMAIQGLPYNKIDTILYTHLHADHMTDFVDIMINRWMTGGKHLEIMGPPRSGAYLDFMRDFYADDLTYRQYRGHARGITAEGMFTGVNVTELTGSNTFPLADMTVTTQALTHTMYNLGYRFEVNGKSIVVTGDTSYDEGLIALAKRADVLVIDANIMASTANKDEEEQAFTDNSIEKPKPKYAYAGNFDVAPHMGIDEVAKTAALANVKTVVLTHLPPGPFSLDKVMPYFEKVGFKGQVLEATDGLEITPA